MDQHTEQDEELARTLGRHLPLRPNHPRGTRQRCPQCGGDCGRVAIADVVYVFDECSCPVVDYTHLVEQLWHRACFKAAP
jgi:hypothetical protein